MKSTRVLFLLACLLLHKRVEATINFPATLDSDTTLHLVVTGVTEILASHHNDLKDAVIALETKVGIDSSAVTTSLDYLVKNAASVDPGHKHTGTSVTFADGSAAAPGLRFGNPVTDTTTGLFHPGAGSIAVASAGAEIVRVTSTGFGILTSSPFFPLDVVGTARLQGASSLCFGGSGGADNDTCMARSAAHVLTLTGNAILNDAAATDNTLTLNGFTAKSGDVIRIKTAAADANPIVSVSAAGRVQFGAGGGTAVDTNLYRSAVDTLKTDDSLVVDGTSLTMSNDAGGAQSVVVGTTNGLKIGAAASQKLGFFNATPVVQQLASTALVTALQNLGLIASGTFSGDITTTGTVTTGGLVGTTQAVVAANGANNNVTLNAGTTVVRITGPTGAFSVSGFTGGVDGRKIDVYSTVSQTLTITNDATSTAANRIFTQQGSDMVCTATEVASFTMVYDGTSSRWRVLSVVNCPATPWT